MSFGLDHNTWDSLVGSPLSLSQPLPITSELQSNLIHKERRGLSVAIYALPELAGFGNTWVSEVSWDPALGHRALEGKLSFDHVWMTTAFTIGEKSKFPGSTGGHLVWLTSLILLPLPAAWSCMRWPSWLHVQLVLAGAPFKCRPYSE